MKEFVIIGGNYGNAGAIKGTDKGCMLLKDFVLSTYKVEDGGNLPDYSESDNEDLDCIEEFTNITNILSDKVFEYLNIGNRVLTIGGDHSIALGTIWGASRFAKKDSLKFGVIYIDAHGDINDCEHSQSKHIHGMPLAYAVGIENFGFKNLLESLLDHKNLLYLGTRSLDQFEKSVISEKKIKVIDAKEIEISSIKEIEQQIDTFINQNKLEAIHLSIDIDAVDPRYAPGTGVPEGNGLNPEVFLHIVKKVNWSGLVSSIDIVEFNPLLDEDYKTEILCRDLCDILINNG